MILAVTLVVGLIGAFMLLQVAQLILKLRSADKLATNRSGAAGLADQVNWAALADDGVVLCKSGALMASWMYRGADHGSSTATDMNEVSRHINNAVRQLGSGFMIHIDAVRQASPGYPDASRSAFPDPVCAAIDEERRWFFNRQKTAYEGRFFITLTWTPPAVAADKAVKFLIEEDLSASARKSAKESTLDILATFKKSVDLFETRIGIAVKLERLCGVFVTDEETSQAVHFDRQLEYLLFTLTGSSHPVRVPPAPMYLDQVILAHEAEKGFVPVIAGKYVQCVAIEGFPSASYPGILSALSELALDYRWSTRFICLDQHQALKEVTNFRKKWQQKMHGILYQLFGFGNAKPNIDASLMVDDAELAEAELQSHEVSGGFYTSVIVLMDDEYEPLQEAAKEVVQLISQLGFAARIETVNTMEAFLGSLPGHAEQNLRRPPMTSANFADLIPTSSVWVGSEYCPNPLYPPGSPPLLFGVTTGQTPFRVNLHVHDVGHTFMFGPTGGGKSINLGLTAAQARRYPDMTVFAFDKGHSIFALAKSIWATTKGQDGIYFDIGANEVSFAPFQFLDTDGDVAWYAEWIETILRLNEVPVSPKQRNLIVDCLKNLQASKAKGQVPTLSHFYLQVQDESIREALKQYTMSGAMKDLLDAEKDGLTMARFTCFEMGELLEMGDKYALPVLLYIFRRIEKSLRRQPAIIILDEAWVMLGHEVFREKIREWLKTLRRANCLVLMATQSLSDAERSGILDVINESTPTKIFLPNAYATDEATAKLYKRFGLNERQIDIISKAIPKRQYYLVSGEGRRLYELALSHTPLAMAILGASDRESLAQIRLLIEEHGFDWLNVWLAKKNLSLSDYADMLEAA